MSAVTRIRPPEMMVPSPSRVKGCFLSQGRLTSGYCTVECTLRTELPGVSVMKGISSEK